MAESGKPGPNFKYSPLFPAVAREHYLHGATHAKVARLLGVTVRTVMRWVEDHEEFRTAYREGKGAAAQYRISQMPPPTPLFPRTAPARPGLPERGEPITRVEQYFVTPPIRHR